MQDKNSKSICQVTRTESDQGFVLFRSDTIQLWSWLEGNQQLDDQSLKSLSEDISYRIRESLDNAASLMHQCKRSELKTSDVNQAFKLLNIEKTFGYGAKEPLQYQIIKTEDIKDKVLNQCKSAFFELEDPVVELRLLEDNLNAKVDNNLHGNWFVVNGCSVDYRNGINDSNVSIEFDGSDNDDIESNFFYPQINHDYKEYFEKVTNVILGEHECPNDDQELLNMVMNDFRTNPKLQPVVAYLIHFFHQTVQVLTVNISDTKKEILMLDYLDRVLCSVKSLILNKNVFLAPKGFFTKILSTLLYSCLQNSHLGFNLSIQIRQKSAFILVMFLKLYERFSSETIKYVLNNFIKPTLNETISDTKQISCLIGVASLLHNFGGQIIDDYYEEICKLASELDLVCGKSKSMSLILKQFLLECLTRHFKWMLRKNLSKNPNAGQYLPKILDSYKKMVDLYGDSFVNQILNLHDSYLYKNIFDMKIKSVESECEAFKIKLRNHVMNSGQVFEQNMEEIFENYSMVKNKDIDFKFGKVIRKRQTNVSIKHQCLISTDKKLISIKYYQISKKVKAEFDLNLNFFYRDAFI